MAPVISLRSVASAFCNTNPIFALWNFNPFSCYKRQRVLHVTFNVLMLQSWNIVCTIWLLHAASFPQLERVCHRLSWLMFTLSLASLTSSWQFQLDARALDGDVLVENQMLKLGQGEFCAVIRTTGTAVHSYISKGAEKTNTRLRRAPTSGSIF